MTMRSISIQMSWNLFEMEKLALLASHQSRTLGDKLGANFSDLSGAPGLSVAENNIIFKAKFYS